MTGIIIFSLFALLIAFVALLLKGVRARLIVKADDLGLTTKSGKYYLWNDLRRIEYFMALDRANRNKKVHSIHFYFAGGKASAGYLMPIIIPLLQRAQQLQVPKSEKITGNYIR